MSNVCGLPFRAAVGGAVRRVAAPYKENTKRIYSPLNRRSPLPYHLPPLAQIIKTVCGVGGAG